MSESDLTTRLATAAGLSEKAAEYVSLCLGFSKYCPDEELEKATKVIAGAAWQFHHPGSGPVIVIIAEEDAQ